MQTFWWKRNKENTWGSQRFSLSRSAGPWNGKNRKWGFFYWWPWARWMTSPELSSPSVRLKGWLRRSFKHLLPKIWQCVCVCRLSHWVLSGSCDPIDCSPPGSSVHGISQARMWDWASISFSRRSSWPKDQNCISGASCLVKQILYHCATTLLVGI